MNAVRMLLEWLPKYLECTWNVLKMQHKCPTGGRRIFADKVYNAAEFSIFISQSLQSIECLAGRCCLAPDCCPPARSA